MDALNSADMLLLGAFRFDRRNRALFHLDSDAQIPIGSRALGVLGVLIERAGDLVPKDEIMEAVWPETVVEKPNNTVLLLTAIEMLLVSGLPSAVGTPIDNAATPATKTARFITLLPGLLKRGACRP